MAIGVEHGQVTSSVTNMLLGEAVTSGGGLLCALPVCKTQAADSRDEHLKKDER